MIFKTPIDILNIQITQKDWHRFIIKELNTTFKMNKNLK